MQTETIVMHPFHSTLGAGPYRFVGMFCINLQAGAMGRPYYNPELVHKNFVRGAGTCAHCGHAILNVCQVMIGNGEVYGIGIDCIEKVDLPVIEMAKIDKVKKAHAKALRDARKAKKDEIKRLERVESLEKSRVELQALIHDGILKQFPHVNEHFAMQGMTLNDYAIYALGGSMAINALVKIKSIMGRK
jgi:hypothetical protein